MTSAFMIPLLISSLAIKCELVDRNRERKQKNQPITYFIPNPFTRDLERKIWQPSSILNESEASVSASVVLIHTK